MAVKLDSACANRLSSLKFVGDTFSVSELIAQTTLTLDLLTLKLMRVIARWVGNLLPILEFLGLFVLDLWANNCQMDYVTLDQAQDSPFP